MQKKRENEKVDTTFWDERRGKIFTKIGGVVTGEAVYCRGYSMMDDLVGKSTYFQVLVLNVTGRLVERALADWLEAYYICISYPDARVWCNQVGSLGGAMRATPVAAVTAGTLTADSRMYGPGTTYGGVGFITGALKKKQKGMSAEEIVESYPRRRPDGVPMIPGFNRPVTRGDERVVALERVTRDLGFEIGEHLSLSFEIEAIMTRKYKEGLNAAGYRMGFLSDQGFSAEEIYRIMSVLVNSGVNACYSEAADLPPESFFPLRCDDVDYQGEPARPLPNRS